MRYSHARMTAINGIIPVMKSSEHAPRPRRTWSPLVEEVEELERELRSFEEGRYVRRIHGIMMIANGMSPAEVAEWLHESQRTVNHWVRRYTEEGLPGLAAIRERKRSGRLRTGG